MWRSSSVSTSTGRSRSGAHRAPSPSSACARPSSWDISSGASCSDWPVSRQQRMREEHGIPVAFTVLKHHLDRVRAEFSAEEYIHIGDTDMDRHYAERNGFACFCPDDSMDHLWEPPATASR